MILSLFRNRKLYSPHNFDNILNVPHVNAGNISNINGSEIAE